MAKSKAPPILRHFQLMPEWLGQSALRIAGDDGIFDEIGAEEAGFSETIADRFEDWMDAFDAIYDEDDPPSSCFESSAEFDAWRREGEAIATQMRKVLLPGERLDVLLPIDLGPK